MTGARLGRFRYGSAQLTHRVTRAMAGRVPAFGPPGQPYATLAACVTNYRWKRLPIAMAQATAATQV